MNLKPQKWEIKRPNGFQQYRNVFLLCLLSEEEMNKLAAEMLNQEIWAAEKWCWV